MSEIAHTSTAADSARGTLVKKRPTKVDMTPLVDLAFLLLMFFILTATFNKNRVLEVGMPDPSGGAAPVNADNVLNLVLAEGDRIYWWMGLASPVTSTDYSKEGLRTLLLRKNGENPRLVVLIKPKRESRFQNMVDVLDEMNITRTRRFAIIEFASEDRRVLDAYQIEQ
jgi:biopolymer transport protein ExbD